MSMWSDREELIRKQEEDEILRKAAKILEQRFAEKSDGYNFTWFGS